MTEQHTPTGERRWWTNVLQWVRAMEEAGDTSEVKLLERRVHVLEAAVADMRHVRSDRVGATETSPPAA